MLTLADTGSPFTSVTVAPRSPAGKHYREGRKAAARAGHFPAEPSLNLRYFGGHTIEHLTFTNIYLGGHSLWSADDIKHIDGALAAAMADRGLNNVMDQYWADEKATTAFKASRVLAQPVPGRVYRDTVESFVAGLAQENALSGFDLASSVFCFLLPRGVILVDGDSPARRSHAGEDRPDAEDDDANLAASAHDDAVDSKHGLGGYHGSIHPRHGGKSGTVYYAVSVYSEGTNGIVAFDRPWKSVCATLYHELCEARTDPDVEDAIKAGDSPKANGFLGWYSDRGGEIGDIPMEEAGANLSRVMKEVPLANGRGKVPIQLMWSNAVSGPEGPIKTKHPPADRSNR